CRKSISILDAGTGQIKSTIENATGSDYIARGKYDVNLKRMITPHYNADVAKTCISILDPSNGEQTDIGLSEGYFLDCCVTPDGNIAVVSCNTGAYKTGVERVVAELMTPEGKTLWTRELDAHVKNHMSFSTIVKAHKYQSDEGERKDIVIAIEAQAFTLDEDTGRVLTSFNLPGDATALSVRNANSYGQVGYWKGNIDLIDFAQGRISQEYSIETDEGIKEWLVLTDKIVYASPLSPDLHVLTWHKAPDIEDYANFEDGINPVAVSADGSYYAVNPSKDFNSLIFLDKDGNELYTFNNESMIRSVRLCADKAYVSDKEGLWIVDPRNKQETSIKIADHGFEYSADEDYITPDGSKAVFWDLRNMIILDVAEGKKLYDHKADGNLGKAILSNDGSKAYVLASNKNMQVINTSDGSITEPEEDTYRVAAGSYDKVCLAISPDDKYVALCCMDGMLRVADTSTLDTVVSIPLKSYLKSYVSFTDDGTHLVIQGDDYRIRILDMNTGKIVYTMDSSATVDHLVCDDENGLMAICTGYGLFLFETDGYGCVAYADHGLMYLKANKSILLSSDRKLIERTYYKDYEALIKEAEKQFPGAELSDEKKVKYNIN
ncbi:MAG: WD40 repeat domain-containing protein, partial [Lachnospiraceae bacterium]|nr:WD40 repeat domain-containing protein [Lachnospiraceae bacterium]